ncbi:ATP-binding protein [Streptomyces actuosus]|uniref:ATP-binding protein n=1 Tax=Streptomyces actuosus TaxID=1885 RepID=A0ABS2VL70_STRAS|nr:ATP-binding protein [Streptomyces actuosus]MBN0043850.1 ATP-binding protein [Streptomyces actuosus]
MAHEPRGDEPLAFQEVPSRTTCFSGEPHDVTGARLAAEEYLRDLARVTPPRASECYHDVLLIVGELAANAVQYAPGPFELRMRRTFDGVHVTVHDSSSERPAPRPFRPSRSEGGIGWYLIETLCTQVSVVSAGNGKDVHVFLPW